MNAKERARRVRGVNHAAGRRGKKNDCRNRTLRILRPRLELGVDGGADGGRKSTRMIPRLSEDSRAVEKLASRPAGQPRSAEFTSAVCEQRRRLIASQNIPLTRDR